MIDRLFALNAARAQQEQLLEQAAVVKTAKPTAAKKPRAKKGDGQEELL